MEVEKNSYCLPQVRTRRHARLPRSLASVRVMFCKRDTGTIWLPRTLEKHFLCVLCTISCPTPGREFSEAQGNKTTNLHAKFFILKCLCR